MEQKTHNPHCRLIETNIFNGTSHVQLVYAIENNGTNEGLEAYYKKERDSHFHKSRRWLTEDVPNMYKKYFEALKDLKSKVSDGHKAVISITDLLGN